MTEWEEINVQLLLTDRCLAILSKALPLLDWNNFKLYLSNSIIDITKIIDYFKIPL
jgi:hypothetical protein